MRLDILAVLGLATTVTADAISVYSNCIPPGGAGCADHRGVFYTGYGGYPFDARDGCKSTGVPGMNEFCIDWTNLRGHFRFDGGGKRCFVQTFNRKDVPCTMSYWSCSFTTWVETGCTW